MLIGNFNINLILIMEKLMFQVLMQRQIIKLYKFNSKFKNKLINRLRFSKIMKKKKIKYKNKILYKKIIIF